MLFLRMLALGLILFVYSARAMDLEEYKELKDIYFILCGKDIDDDPELVGKSIDEIKEHILLKIQHLKERINIIKTTYPTTTKKRELW